MSDKSVSGAKSLSRTLVAGSEEDFDIKCDFCYTDGKRVEAVGYCVNCGEYLCEECKTNHKKTSATKKHVLQDKSKMPEKKPAGHQSQAALDTADPLADRCETHPQELIKFYCNSHKQLGCSVCLSLHHRTCQDMSYIPEVSSCVTGSQELKQIQAELIKLVAILECCNSRSEWCQQEADTSYNQVMTDVKQFRQNINKLLDKLEGELLKQAAKLKQGYLESLTRHTPRCHDLIEEIQGMNTDLDGKGALSHYNQLFVAMKTAQKKLPVLEKEADSINQLIRTRRLTFSRDDKLDDLTSSVTSLGTVSLAGNPEGTRAKYLYDITVKSDTDANDCLIHDVVVLPDGRLAVTDFKNKSVKLIDTEGSKVSEQVSFTSKPCYITMTGDDELAVTLMNEEYIQLLSVSPTLSASHTIARPDCLYTGITHNAGKLYLACAYPVFSVHICDMSGNLLQQIDKDNTGNKLFECIPSGIILSQDKSCIYVSEVKGNKVVCLNKEGVVMATYMNDRLQCPFGIAVDDHGYVYVCSRDTVHQLTPHGKLVRILLEEKDGIIFPNAIAHSDEKLYTCSGSDTPALSNSIKVYSLE